MKLSLFILQACIYRHCEPPFLIIAVSLVVISTGRKVLYCSFCVAFVLFVVFFLAVSFLCKFHLKIKIQQIMIAMMMMLMMMIMTTIIRKQT